MRIAPIACIPAPSALLVLVELEAAVEVGIHALESY